MPTENVKFPLFIQRLCSSFSYSPDSFTFDRNDRLFDSTKKKFQNCILPRTLTQLIFVVRLQLLKCKMICC